MKYKLLWKILDYFNFSFYRPISAQLPSMKCTSSFIVFSQWIFSAMTIENNSAEWSIVHLKKFIKKRLKWKLWWTSALTIPLVLQQLHTLRKFYFLLRTFPTNFFSIFSFVGERKEVEMKIFSRFNDAAMSWTLARRFDGRIKKFQI